MERGRIHGLNVLSTPYYLRNALSYELQIWQVYSQDPSQQRPLKFGRQGSVGVSRDCPNFLSTPIIPGTRQATNFKFGRYIHRVHPSKRPLKLGRKGSVGVSRDCRNFFQYPLLSHERVKLRTSNFVRTFLVSIRTKAHSKFREK